MPEIWLAKAAIRVNIKLMNKL